MEASRSVGWAMFSELAAAIALVEMVRRIARSRLRDTVMVSSEGA